MVYEPSITRGVMLDGLTGIFAEGMRMGSGSKGMTTTKATAKANAEPPPLPPRLCSGSGRDDAGVGGVEGLISRVDSLFVILLRG